jgi:hypothetical protein
MNISSWEKSCEIEAAVKKQQQQFNFKQARHTSSGQ